ncbi:MAG: pitrilysin family protein [Gemmatimonadaceae bacterium]
MTISRALVRGMFAAGLLVPALVAAQKEAPPAPGTPKDFRMPAHRTIQLPNGMQVTLIPYGRVPKTAIELSIRTGVIDEGPNDVSLSSVTGDLLLEGTATRTSQQISREAADMGGSLSAQSGAETVALSGEVLSDFGPRFVALLADVARNPKFDPSDLAKVIDRHARDNAMALAQPGTLAQKAFREMMFADHPFAHVFPSDVMLRGFTAPRVREFYTRNFGAARAHLYVSGIFNADAMERAARTAFESWAAGSPPTVKPPVLASKRQVAVIDRPKSVQSSIWMGLPVADPSNADWTKLNVTDALLGGAFGSRITTNIREDKGYTYSPSSFLWTRKGASLWVEVADVTSNVTGPALTEIVKEITRLRTEPASDAELMGIKNNLAGLFTIQNSSRAGVINQLEFTELHGLGDTYLTNYIKNVMAVTPEDVRATAQKYIDPSKLSMAIVGDRKIIDKQLGEFKPVVP